MTNNKRELLPKDIIGKNIVGLVCHKYYLLNDVLVVQDLRNTAKAIILSSLSTSVKLYSIKQETIDKVQVTNDGKMFLFHTITKQYLVNDQNNIVEDSDQWSDSYFDMLSSSFYRKDDHGNWYDIAGFKMQEIVFLIEDVLISLETKQSKKSLSFKGQNLYLSEKKQLIQIGKVVLDLNLELVKYFGNKITGLGSTHISFEGKDVLQEVKLGMNEKAFINEFSHEPYLFNDNKIEKHIASYDFGQKRIDIFQSDNKSFAVEGKSDNFLTYKELPLKVELQNHIGFNNSELIKVTDGKRSFYYDLNENKPFRLPSLDNINIVEIEKRFVRVGKSSIFNMSIRNEQFTVNERDGKIYLLNKGTVKPERIEDAKLLQKYYAFAIVDGQRKMFSKKQQEILKFGKDELEISEITFNSSDKLINAIDTNSNKLVLDLRNGFEEISIAETNGDTVLEVYGESMKIGNRVLQNALVATLGGNTRRVIDLNEKSLPCFTLPEQLKQISGQETASLFAGEYIIEIHFLEEQLIEGKAFISADFASYSGKEYPIILEKESGHPLHLHGEGHRNELASTWVDYTLNSSYYLGNNRMIGVKTITENLNENELLFSIQKLSSWLPFYENFLPLFKRVIKLNKDQFDSWDFNLFELREASREKEYVAVEKNAPFRILAEKKSDEYQPRIIKSKKKSIKSPEELNTLKRFFYLNSEVLVEVE